MESYEETKININIELNTTDLNIGDEFMKKMLRALTEDELLSISSARVSKTISEIEITSEAYQDK